MMTKRKTNAKPSTAASSTDNTTPDVGDSFGDAVVGTDFAASAAEASAVELETVLPQVAEYLAADENPINGSTEQSAAYADQSQDQQAYGYDDSTYPAATDYGYAAAAVDVGPRRVRLALSRVDPLSVMKLSLLLSFALGIMMVVATYVFWHVLDGMHVFTKINDMILDVTGEGSTVNILDYLELSKVMSYVTLIAIVDLFILTALATLGAFLYNITASLVGGVYVTLIDE